MDKADPILVVLRDSGRYLDGELLAAKRVIDAMLGLGDDQRAGDIATKCGMPANAVRAVLGKMERLGVVARKTQSQRWIGASGGPGRGGSPIKSNTTVTFSLVPPAPTAELLEVKVNCTECGKEIGELEVFPKGKCLSCHEKHWRPGTAEEFVNSWRSGFLAKR